PPPARCSSPATTSPRWRASETRGTGSSGRGRSSGRVSSRAIARSPSGSRSATSSSTGGVRSPRSPRRYVVTFADVPEQVEAKRLLEAALGEGPAHAYLFHGPAGAGKRVGARAFAGALPGAPRRVDGGTHPDLRVIEALGEMIRIDVIRELHHDLHMRPFEADWRVYLLLDAHLLNDEAGGGAARGRG